MSILVVRHAHAGDREAWEGPDAARPLTRRGLAQADGLVAVLASFPVERILSSPAVRCTQTVEPLAAARGLPVEPCDAVAEGAGPAAVALIGALAGGEAGPDVVLCTQGDIVLCTHGDVVLEVLEALAGDGVELPEEPPLRKGSTWVLAVQGGRVVGARYLDRPASSA